MTDRGMRYTLTAVSRRAAAIARIRAWGYMAMRWYQQYLHGSKWATSE